MKNLNEYGLFSVNECLCRRMSPSRNLELKNDTSHSLSNLINDNTTINESEFDIDTYNEESDGSRYESGLFETDPLAEYEKTAQEGTTGKTHLLLTNTIKLYNKNKIRKEYEIWLRENYDMLQSSFYIISNKFLGNCYKNITFKKFTEFCFLHY